MAEADSQLQDGTRLSSSAYKRGGILRVLSRLLLGLVAVVFLAWLVLYITKGRFLKSVFESYASTVAGREIKVGGDFQLYFDPITIKFVADDMQITNPAWRSGDFYTARHVELRIATFPLLWGTRRIQWLDMQNAKVDLAWDAAHKRNTFTFGDPDQPGQPFKLPDIVTAQVIRTTIGYADPLLFLKTQIAVETVKAKDTRVSGDIGFTGTGTLRAKPFTLTGRLMSPNATVAGGRNQLALTARSAGTILDISGTLPGATIIEGADLKMVAQGPNFADLVDFLGAAVPATRAYRVTSDLTKEGGAWKLTHISGRFGDSDMAGRLTVTMPANRLHFAADLTTRSLDIIDAGPFIGYDANLLAKGQVTTIVGGTPRLLPDAPLRIEAIRRFDADVRYHVQHVRAPNLPISNIGVVLALDHGLMTMSPVTLDVAGGHLSADISLDARSQPVFSRYDIRLSPTPLGTLLARFGTDQSGTRGTVKARVQMTGTGDSLRASLAASNGRIAFILPQGSFWTRNVQLSELDVGTYVQKLIGHKLKDPIGINCGLVGFTVRQGVAAADPVLIDTAQNVILGRGGFSFRNEAIDLAVRADSKKFSLFSAQSPIGINGYFAKPGISVISPQLLERAGAGLGLALIASPLAAVAAFVDVGDAKGAQCGPVLAGASARAQRTVGGRPRDDVGKGRPDKAENNGHKKFLGLF